MDIIKIKYKKSGLVQGKEFVQEIEAEIPAADFEFFKEKYGAEEVGAKKPAAKARAKKPAPKKGEE
jgi:hypothetical protein